MSRICVIAVVLISLLFAFQTRAAHACGTTADGVPAAAAQADQDLNPLFSGELPTGDHADGSASHGHGAGHCDLCAHISVGAGAPHVMAWAVVATHADEPVSRSAREPANPPLGRPDKPPR